jgi:cytochrome c
MNKFDKTKWVIVAAAALAINGGAWASADLAKSSGCLNCHDVSAKKMGPAFKDVAAKNKGKADAAQAIVAKLKSGKGHPPAKASEADLTTIVKWVLAQ